MMPRRLHTWKVRSRELALGERTLIMGVLNVTPDSFSDGGEFSDPDKAYAHALEMEEQGADIIDIGAESTRPGSHPISAAEELRRLVPVLKRLREKLSIPISVDTYKAEVAERALELGVDIINDPSGFTFDPLLSKPIVQYDAGVILNHMRGRPETWSTLGPLPDVMGAIVKDLDASVNRARRAGVDRLRIVIDPGLGFGKRREQNSEILARLGEMTRLELPILVGPSRKSFLAQPNERETEFATAAAVTASVLGGAHLVRVHDVAAMKPAVHVADEVLRAILKIAEARELAESEAPSKRGRVSMATPQIQATAQKPPVRPPLGARFVRAERDQPANALPDSASSENGARESEPAQPQAAPSRSIRERAREDRAGQHRPDESGPARPADRDQRPPRPYNRESRSSGPPRPSDRDNRSSRPPSGARPSRPPFGSRPPRPSDRDERSARPSYGARPPRSDDQGERSSRPPSRPPSGSRPPGSYERGDRPSRPPSRSPFGARPGSGSRPPRSDDRGERSSRPPTRPPSRTTSSSTGDAPRSPRPFRSNGPGKSGAGKSGAGKSGPYKGGAYKGGPRNSGPPRKSGPPRDFRPRPRRDD